MSNIKIIEYFKKIKDELGVIYDYPSYDEHFKICIDNRLISCKLYQEFRKNNPELNLHSRPWDINILQSSEYFNNIKDELGVMCHPSHDEHFKICVDNRLISFYLYKRFVKNNNNLKLILNISRSVGMTTKEYFQKVKDVLDEKSKIEREYKPAYLGEFSEMNKKWNTSNSKTTHDRLKSDKSEWIKYHELYSKSRQNWSEIPYKEIGKILKNRPEWIVGDFGCGENLLKLEIPNKVISLDHVSIDDSVISCDLTNVPLDNNSLDVVVFSLSLMGTNYNEYLKEAYRTLKSMGMIIISEPSTRWENKEESLKELLIESGFSISGDVKHSDRFIYITSIKL